MTHESITKRLWKEMGVEPWYLRPDNSSKAEILEKPSEVSVVLISEEQSSSMVLTVEETQDLVSPVTPDPFQFQYLNSDAAVWLFTDDSSVENRRILEDIDLAFGFLKCGKTSKKARKLGVFEWPLVGSSGDPTKALSALFEKYQSEGKEVFICQKTQEKVGSFLGKDYSYRVIPSLNELIGNGMTKKSVWEILKSIPD